MGRYKKRGKFQISLKMAERDNLVSHLEAVLSKQEDFVIVLLLDSSGSVGSQYEDLRLVSLNLIEKLKGLMIQVLQFSSTVETVCPFTIHTDTLIKRVKGTHQQAYNLTNQK
jgi:hypothetical protein